MFGWTLTLFLAFGASVGLMVGGGLYQAGLPGFTVEVASRQSEADKIAQNMGTYADAFVRMARANALPADGQSATRADLVANWLPSSYQFNREWQNIRLGNTVVVFFQQPAGTWPDFTHEIARLDGAQVRDQQGHGLAGSVMYPGGLARIYSPTFGAFTNFVPGLPPVPQGSPIWVIPTQ